MRRHTTPVDDNSLGDRAFATVEILGEQCEDGEFETFDEARDNEIRLPSAPGEVGRKNLNGSIIFGDTRTRVRVPHEH